MVQDEEQPHMQEVFLKIYFYGFLGLTVNLVQTSLFYSWIFTLEKNNK